MQSNTYKALFILPVATQPRYAKRITNYIQKGFDVTVASFERDYFNLNKLPSSIKYISLGSIKNKNYLKRIPKLIYSSRKILALMKVSNAVFIFSADLLIMFSIFFKRGQEIYYEIGDIRILSSNKMINTIYNFLYRKALFKCTYIFVTSEEFKQYLTEKYSLNPLNVLVIENKLSTNDFSPKTRTQFNYLNNELIVGIIGLLRYKNIIHFLEAFKKNNSNFKIKIFGDGPLKEDILKFIDDDSIMYFGQFKNPDDLPKIYEQIHLSFTMYDSNDLNVRLALPNKLYETIYFQRPILASSYTFLETKIKEYKIGFSWNQDNMNGLVKFLDSLEFKENYNSLSRNFSLIDDQEFLA